MMKGYWRKSEMLPVLFTMICGVAIQSIGATSVTSVSSANESAKFDRHVSSESPRIIRLDLSSDEINGTELPKAQVGKVRRKRDIMQMAKMLTCMTPCNPLTYTNYGCFCGYRGAGSPVDEIDRCCFEHDFCYAFAACPKNFVYFFPYKWKCVSPGTAVCDLTVVSLYDMNSLSYSGGFSGEIGEVQCLFTKYCIRALPLIVQTCAAQLCECDREFARCIGQYPCPRMKRVCEPYTYRSVLQTLTNFIR